MKHWDLRPGEDVTLSCGSEILAGRFKFRDTRHAAVLIHAEDGDHLRFFTLSETGDLRSMKNGILRAWTIRGADRQTRGAV